MKRARKIAGITGLSFATFIILLLLLPLLFSDQIAALLVNEINNRSTLTIRPGKVSLSFLRDFPRASVEFRDVDLLIPGEGLSGSHGLHAKLIFLSFSPRELAGKDVGIDRITIRDGRLEICTDSLASVVESFRRRDSEGGDSSSVSFELRSIRIERTEVILFSGESRFAVAGKIEDLQGRIASEMGSTGIKTTGKLELTRLTGRGRELISPTGTLDLVGSILFTPGTITLEELLLASGRNRMGATGFIETGSGRLSITASAEAVSTALFTSVLPGELSGRLNGIIGEGEVSSRVTIEGNSRDGSGFRIDGKVANSSVVLLKSGAFNGAIIRNLNGTVSLHSDNPSGSFKARVEGSDISYGGSEYSLRGSLTGLRTPQADITLSGECDPAKLLKVHPIKQISAASGNIHITARLRGTLATGGKMSVEQLSSLHRDINLHFSNVDLSLSSPSLNISSVKGNAMISESIWLDELSFTFEEQHFIVNSRIDQLNSLIKGQGETGILAGIWADRFDYSTISGLVARGEDRPGTGSRPKGPSVVATVSFDTDSLVIGRFRAAQASSTIIAGGGSINISSFSLAALGGSISGKAMVASTADKGYRGSGYFDLASVDINETFRVFNNFGQQQLIADNIMGSLSGSLAVEASTGSDLKVLMPSLKASGSYSILNGELNNFEPAQKLSRFVEVSELANIRFSELRNSLDISDSRLRIPSMEISSSAFNISLAGEQEFNGKFDYHLKVLLSEILSRKAKRSTSYTQEFGPVEDDGLGNTTLYLRIHREGEETKVSYDMKELSRDIKTDIAREKQTLKSILNEEYGWYTGDSAAVIPKESVRRFKIVWEESDSIKSVDPAAEKESPKGVLKILRNPGTRGKQVSDTTKKKL